MAHGENYPSDILQFLTRYGAIVAMVQGNNARFLRRRFSLDSSSHANTATSRALTDGIQVATGVISQTIGAQKLNSDRLA